MPSQQHMPSDDAQVIDEIIACARYGEYKELLECMKSQPTIYLITKSNFGNTALHMACANGHLEIVTYIIDQLQQLASSPSTDNSKIALCINIQNEWGNTPLHWSALNGHKEVVELLIKNGANVHIKNKAGRTAMYEAQQNNHEKIVEYLLNVVDPIEPQTVDENIEADEKK
ncbi:5268_t:CDS:2 [Ambispora leptoticha]|uniref:5268_t:CDS:1 n=1 Tax=Ambispora leptoticha TaxID=144679 RepID=A0A9N8ZYS2_9GLOM|nr:5268_t:CDS:2 [Ambispora leptoticha]